MMKKITLAAIIACFVSQLYADNFSAARYTLISSYPKYTALGTAASAAFFDVAAVDLNPAGLSEIKNADYSVMHNVWSQGITSERVTLARAFEPGVMGLDLSYYDLGTIRKVGMDAYGAPVLTQEDITLRAVSAGLSWAKKARGLSIGVTPKIIAENFGEESNYYFGADAGFIYEDAGVNDLDFGISLLNISAEDSGFFLPIKLKCGIVYTYMDGADEVVSIAAGGGYLVKDEDITGGFGVNYAALDFLIMRGGINIGNRTDLAFSAGFGIRMESLMLNYSYVPGGTLGDVHKLSLEGTFDRPAPSAAAGKDEVVERGKGDFETYVKSGDYYYQNKQYSNAIKYYEYVNLLYWKDVEKLSDKDKSLFYQKVGICYYNMRDTRRAKQYFDRALYYDKDNEILKHWVRLIK